MSRAAVQPAQHCHNVDMQTKRGLVRLSDSAEFRLAVFVVKKLGVQLHGLSHR